MRMQLHREAVARIAAGLLAASLVSGGGIAWAALAKDQQACVNGLDKSLASVEKAVAKQVAGCFKNHAAGKPLNAADPAVDTLDECVADDPKGAVLKAETKAQSAFVSQCQAPPAGKLTSPFPPFGATDPATASSAAAAIPAEVARDLYGASLDGGALATKAGDPAAAKCQDSVWKAAGKCKATRLKEFATCLKNGLAGRVPPGLVASAAALRDACLGVGASGQPDSGAKIAKACGGVGAALTKGCLGVDLATRFPGCPGSTAACVERAVACRVCLALNGAHGLDRNCDELDDAAANGSCGCVGPDTDGDGVPASCDNCPTVPNPEQDPTACRCPCTLFSQIDVTPARPAPDVCLPDVSGITRLWHCPAGTTPPLCLPLQPDYDFFVADTGTQNGLVCAATTPEGGSEAYGDLTPAQADICRSLILDSALWAQCP